MAEVDAILKRYTDPATGCVHGATFIAVDSQGMEEDHDVPSHDYDYSFHSSL
jgi:hypothetical protein